MLLKLSRFRSLTADRIACEKNMPAKLPGCPRGACNMHGRTHVHLSFDVEVGLYIDTRKVCQIKYFPSCNINILLHIIFYSKFFFRL